MGHPTDLRMSGTAKIGPFGSMGKEVKRNLDSDNDAKIIIQGANSQTGIGKTTLAIRLCRYLDQTEEGWSAEKKAFVDVQKYMNAHLEYPEGSCLLLDEIGAGADSRRAMSQTNVDLSQAWQTLRARNIAVVATLPSISMLDGRMLELSDWWVLVEKRGVAKPHRVNVNDYAPNRNPQKQWIDEFITWDDVADGDPDKEYLDRIKDEMVKEEGVKSIPMPEHRQKVEEAKEEAAHERRNEIIRDVYKNTDLSYANIGELDTIDLTKQTIGQIVRDDD